ncbi:hypothetical protein [Haliscomenobacter hydrossis]|uniref:Uncharacterized protein n=1 Tax=Haliscomenobacter hydrossis (strain ATCC 27775 / DSM 1100 / LMG 10767 / O) TaxID=760192 RepID=F4KU54_HALH1|nr:hypothetical protein [Haliscomenobacter hydrossis]AEE50151.1 hypothetical protein Halhy_2272 [Haliscomenobacter hydrossis DSM 1100]
MDQHTSSWINFLAQIAPDYLLIQQAADGNPLLRVQVGEQRVCIIKEAESSFSFWIERYEGATGESGDELVVDTGMEVEQLRLARNVVEAFLKRRGV